MQDGLEIRGVRGGSFLAEASRLLKLLVREAREQETKRWFAAVEVAVPAV